MSNQEFIDVIKNGAIKAQSELGICASLTIAQAILESGWGKYAPGNNLFGIKWTSGCGYSSQNLLTTEYIDGVAKKVYADFRAYNSLEDSLYDHAQFLAENNRYDNLKGITDYLTACGLIQKDGYATDPNYSNLLIEIIEENNLNQFDIIKEKKEMVGTIVVYGSNDDEGAAKLVADAINCPTMDSQRKYDYSHFNPVICVGAVPNGGMPFTSYCTKLIQGTNRYETAKLALEFIKNGCK